MPNQMPIPTDWNEEEDGYAFYVVCGPNSDQWRRNVRGAIYALTRGRNYDFDTGIFKDIEQIANDLQDSFMSICASELVDELKNITKTNRMIVAALMGQSINFDSEPLPNAINYENGIRQAILGISGALDNEMTLQELKDIIDNIDLTGTDFIDTLTDIAQILAFLFLVFGPDERVVVALGWWDKITLKRWQHNSLTIAAHQATSLRGIMRGITPFKDESEEEEANLWQTIQSIPWLARAVVAIVEPSPAGEAGLIATTIGGTIATVYQTIKAAWNLWWEKWVNLIQTPEPIDSITAALGVIANRISTREDTANNPQVSVTNRLDVIAEALQAIQVSDPTAVLTLIATAITNLDGSPTTLEWQALIDQITVKMEETVPVINVSCGSCGSSSGCNCGGGASSGAWGPGVNGPGDSPPSTLPESGPPSGFPDIPAYNLYKCKAANTIVLNVAEMFATYADFKNANLSQYTVVSVAQQWIAGKISLAGGFWGGILESGANWVSDKILAFVWPYPSPLAVTLGVFSEARLLWLDDREENVCGVYNSSSIAEARSFIEQTMDGYIDGTSYDAGTKVRAKELYKGLLTNQFLNRLFEKDSFIEGYTDSSSIDCSACGAGLYEVVVGESLTVTNGNPFQVKLAPRVGCANGWQTVVTFTEPFKLTSITDLSGYGKCSGLANYIYLYPDQNAAGGSIMDTDSVPAPESYLSANAIAVVVTNATQPTITIGFEWSGEE